MRASRFEWIVAKPWVGIAVCLLAAALNIVSAIYNDQPGNAAIQYVVGGVMLGWSAGLAVNHWLRPIPTPEQRRALQAMMKEDSERAAMTFADTLEAEMRRRGHEGIVNIVPDDEPPPPSRRH